MHFPSPDSPFIPLLTTPADAILRIVWNSMSSTPVVRRILCLISDRCPMEAKKECGPKRLVKRNWARHYAIVCVPSAGKDSIVTNSNDSVTLRLMTEYDLAMPLWVAKSISYRRVVGRRRSTPDTSALDVIEQYLPNCFSGVRHPYIAMLNGEPIGYAQSYVALEAGTMVGRRNRSRSTRNRPVTGECITIRQRLGNQAGSSSGWVAVQWSRGHQDPNGPVAEQLASDPMLRESGGLRGKVP